MTPSLARRLLPAVVAAGFFAATAVHAATSRTYTVEDVLSAPFSTSLTSARAAEQIAWVAIERGVRTVFTAPAPGFEPRVLYAAPGDDGQDLSGLSLTADGRTAVWVRGGPPGKDGASQNPESLPLGVVQEVFAADTAGGPVRRIGPGNVPVLSPDGRVVLVHRDRFVDCHSLVADAKAPEWCTAPLLRLRGGTDVAAFSPDGTRIAFTSQRGDHSFVGVYDTRTRRVTWMAPGVDQDRAPTWSPDGRELAFVRVAGYREFQTLNLTRAEPFELWVADAATGQGRRVFRSGARAGGFAQLSGGHDALSNAPVRWAANGTLVYATEETGWMHLHAVPVTGGPARDLTPGECETESSTLSADRTTLAVSWNCGDIEGRQLAQIGVADGRVQKLHSLGLADVAPVWLGSAKRVAFLSADARRPTAVAVYEANGRPRRVFPAALPPTFPESALIAPKAVTFRAADGLLVHGQLFDAGRGGAKKRPALVFVHGGPIRQMLPAFHYMHYYSNTYALNQYLASRGFVVLSVNYRTGIGYGQAYRLAANQGPRGASEYQDVLAGHAFLAQFENVDPKRIGIWGGSYGGLLTAQALARNSDLFAAGVDYHGVHDWARHGRDFGGGGWDLSESNYAQATASSPVADVDRWRSPVLFVHGDDDRSVEFNQTVDLVQRLREREVPLEVLAFPDEEHDLLLHSTLTRAYGATAEFLERYLKP